MSYEKYGTGVIEVNDIQERSRDGGNLRGWRLKLQEKLFLWRFQLSFKFQRSDFMERRGETSW